MVLDYDSDGIDVIPEEDDAKEKSPKPSKNLFTNLTNTRFECDSNPPSKASSRSSTPDLSSNCVIPENIAKPGLVPAPPVTTIVTATVSANVESSSEVMVNTVVNENQIVLAKKISIFDLKIADIEHIQDKTARDWIVYGIRGFKTLLQFAEHLNTNKIHFDLKKYVSEEFPSHLQFFDPLDITEIVKTLSGDFINRKLEELGNTYRPLLGQRGKRTKQYDYLIPHKAAAMKNTLLAVTVVKQKRIHPCRVGRRDKVRHLNATFNAFYPDFTCCSMGMNFTNITQYPYL